MNSLRMEESAHFEFDQKHNAILLELNGELQHYDFDRQRVKIFGQGAINLGMNLLVDIRECSSALDVVDLFHLSAEIEYLMEESKFFKMAVLITDDKQGDMIIKLQTFIRDGKKCLYPFTDEDDAFVWLNTVTRETA